MSMKKKLIISNIVMVLIPIIFILILNSTLMHNIKRRTINPQYILDISALTQMTYDSKSMEDLISLFQELEQDNGSVTFTNRHGKVFVFNNYGNHEFEDYIRYTTILMLLSTLVIIILTNAVLTSLVSRSVLTPLKILHDGTNRIKQGDLDHEVVYDKKDEFSAICADFEDMRFRLRQSVSKQNKYEDSRKELIAGISHDLMTPLTRIKGYVAGILDGVANTPEKIDYYLKTINSTADTMRRMVDDLFLFSKLDIPSIPFYFERTDLIPYFNDCCQELKLELDKHNINLVLESISDEAFVLLEKDKFRRAILNIIDNSIKYKQEGRGSVTITITKKMNEILIHFQDCGIGVEEEKLHHIFDIFYRTDLARSEPQRGSGLGLAIVKQIVELHNGHVYAQSEKGKGLTVIMSLPNAKGGVKNEKNIDC